MACAKCGTQVCSCGTGTTVSVTRTPNLIGVEDIMFGCGSEEQIRHGCKKTIHAINASTIPLCDADGKATGKTLADISDIVLRTNPYDGCGIDARGKLEFRNWEDAKVTLSTDGTCSITNVPSNMTQRIGFENQDGTCHEGKSWISTMCGLNYNEPNQLAVHNRQWFPFDYLYDMYECMFPQKMECDMNPEDGCTKFTRMPTLCERVTILEAKPEYVVNKFTLVDNVLTVSANNGFMKSVTLPEPPPPCCDSADGSKDLTFTDPIAWGDTKKGAVATAPRAGMYIAHVYTSFVYNGPTLTSTTEDHYELHTRSSLLLNGTAVKSWVVGGDAGSMCKNRNANAAGIPIRLRLNAGDKVEVGAIVELCQHQPMSPVACETTVVLNRVGD